MARVSAVAAIGKNRELGKNGRLLWHIPDDLKRFKALTKGHPVVMGRKTFESIVGYLGGPLPERTNIVVSRTPQHYQGPSSLEANYKGRSLIKAALLPEERDLSTGVMWAASVEEALEKAKKAPGGEEVFIGGGAQIYGAALPHTDRLCLTLVDDAKDADSFFPPYEQEFTRVVLDERREWQGLNYRWVDFER